MANYRTCHNCAHDRNECATRDRVRRSIAGLGVTSIKFNCPDRAPIYRPGDRVSVTWPVCESAGCGDFAGDWNLETWPATVIEERGARFIICVDDVPSDLETPARDYIKSPTLYCKVPPSKLSRLDQPRRLVCQCGETGDGDMNGCADMNGFGQLCKPRTQCLRARLSPTPAPIEGGSL